MPACQECGGCFETKRREAMFCGDPCRKSHHNRRATRGAELYDLLMTMRYDRAHAKDEALWSHICALTSAYRTSDKRKRPGRTSFDRDAHRRLPMTYDVQTGDGR